MEDVGGGGKDILVFARESLWFRTEESKEIERVGYQVVAAGILLRKPTKICKGGFRTLKLGV